VWFPHSDRLANATIARFAEFVGQSGSYDALWRWSVGDVRQFWLAIWRFFDVQADGDPSVVATSLDMPDAQWFPEVALSYAEHVFRGHLDEDVAMHHASELRGLSSWTWGDLRTQTARIRAALQACGVGQGDRVAAYMPNIPETVAAFLATASLGAIWSSAAPEFGARSVIERFAQIQPKVLLAVDGYRFRGRDFDCRDKVAQISNEVGGQLIQYGFLNETGWPEGFLRDGTLAFERVPFAHPLWVLYSSGSTGRPKAIVHSHGGILLEHLKTMHLHVDLDANDCLLWFTTTGWMMWNWIISVLLTSASIVLYDGDPSGETLWDLAADSKATIFGISPAFVTASKKAGIEARKDRELRLRAVGVTGSALAVDGFDWLYQSLGRDIWLFCPSGGTDVCTAFVGGVPTLPVYRGEIQARLLGCDVQVWDEAGSSITGEVGELVVTQAMPSMPTHFWGDTDGSRYREAYFGKYPGVWCHGDWAEITSRGTAIVYGRSDSTINRGGVRMGTSEIYLAVHAIDEVVDALVVDIDGWMPLFVKLREGVYLNGELEERIRSGIREDCSPRHVPNDVFQTEEIPRTLSGKVLEVPIKRILMGADPEQVVSRESLADAASLDYFIDLATWRNTST
jgi:acetoacetyl-CoA synthetase